MSARRRVRATTLLELLVAFSILALVMTAVISFYIEAIAVTAKRDKQSDRLRRFHIGLDKIEQVVREGKVIQLTSFRLTMLALTDISEQDGFPNFTPTPIQFVSKEDGLHQYHNNEDKLVLPFSPGERIIFAWLPESPPELPRQTLLSIELYYSGKEDSRSDMLFRRTLNLDHYFVQPKP